MKKSIWKSLPVLLGLMTWTSCQPATRGSPKPLSARLLSEEYERSRLAVRSKYDGKEIIVRGYVPAAATMPYPEADQGLVLLEEKDDPRARSVACWFSKDQADQFSMIEGGRFITVKGIFNGEAGAQLKFCKLVKVE